MFILNFSHSYYLHCVQPPDAGSLSHFSNKIALHLPYWDHLMVSDWDMTREVEKLYGFMAVCLYVSNKRPDTALRNIRRVIISYFLFQSLILKGCSNMTSAKNGGVQTPPPLIAS